MCLAIEAARVLMREQVCKFHLPANATKPYSHTPVELV